MSWVLSDLPQIPHWCDALLDTVIFLHQACQAGVITLETCAEATVGIFFVAKKNTSASCSIPDVLT